MIVNVDAPYEVARRFLLSRYSIGNVPTLRCWRGEWRKWNGTHYAEMREDALEAELWDFLSKVNKGKFDPQQKHVHGLVAAIKGRVILDAEIDMGAWLGDGDPPWGDGPIICCKNGMVRLSDGKTMAP